MDPPPKGGVHVGALDAIAGLPFRFVAIPGLVEGGYPGPHPPGSVSPRRGARGARRPTSPPVRTQDPAVVPLRRGSGAAPTRACRCPTSAGPPPRATAPLPPRPPPGDRERLHPLLSARRPAGRAASAFPRSSSWRRPRPSTGAPSTGGASESLARRGRSALSRDRRGRGRRASGTAVGCLRGGSDAVRRHRGGAPVLQGFPPRRRRHRWHEAGHALRRLRGSAPGALSPALDPTSPGNHRLSASRLHIYADCGFRYLLETLSSTSSPSRSPRTGSVSIPWSGQGVPRGRRALPA